MTSQIQRGEYLAKAADCVACHTAPGGKPFAGGFRFSLPFGAIYGTNITADKETGIGNWSDDQFVAAVREGVSPHGNLYPAMPYTSYTGMSRDDVLAIKAWLFSLPPVKQANRTNELSFPFNQRWGMAFWNLVFLIISGLRQILSRMKNGIAERIWPDHSDIVRNAILPEISVLA